MRCATPLGSMFPSPVLACCVVQHINVIHRKSIAFVRYRFRANAEFGRVAMGNQSLGNGEILNLRWAYDDPNPVTKRAIERANQDAISAWGAGVIR